MTRTPTSSGTRRPRRARVSVGLIGRALRSWPVAAAIVLGALALIAAIPGGAPKAPPPATPPSSFYTVGKSIAPAAPGTIVRSLRLSSPAQYELWAVLYHSRSATGRDTVVSGLVARPSSPPPAGGYRIVSWAHQTTGFTAARAPSRYGASAAPAIFGAMTLLGYAVAATDYEGLGVGGPPAYEVGVSAGHTVLDAARAARNVLGRAAAGAQVALVGHSEGGQAVLFGAQEQPSYAPDLALKGVIASAPGANLVPALRAYAYSPETQLNVLRVLAAWHQYYGLPVSGLLTDAGIRDALLLLADKGIPDASAVFKAPPSSDPEVVRLAQLNTPGAASSPAPILLLVGTADQAVPPATNTALAAALRRIGDQVDLTTLAGADHNGTLVAGAAPIAAFLRSRMP